MRGWAALGFAALVASCASNQSSSPVSSPARQAATEPAVDTSTILAMVEPAGTFDPTGHAIVSPVADGLELICRVGRPPGVRPLTDRDLPYIGLTPDAAITLARANVIAGLRPMGDVAPPMPPGQVGTIAGDYAEASRVLVHDDWASLSQAMGGHLLVAVPAADTVLYTRGGVPAALTTIAAMAHARMASSPLPISDEVLRWTAGGWEVAAKATAAAPARGS